jgi:hypothetical protein
MPKRRPMEQATAKEMRTQVAERAACRKETA